MNEQCGGRSVILVLVAMVGLVSVLALGGCAKRGATGTTADQQAAEAAAKAEAGPAVTEEPVQAPQAKAEPQPAAKAVPSEGAVRGRAALGDVYFAFDQWTLSEEAKKGLTQSAEALKQNPSAKLVIEGHCDERGSREYNLVLGEKRTQEARQYLEALGVGNPVSVASYGEEQPACTGQHESCYGKNRRAHLMLDSGQ